MAEADIFVPADPSLDSWLKPLMAREPSFEVVPSSPPSSLRGSINWADPVHNPYTWTPMTESPPSNPRLSLALAWAFLSPSVDARRIQQGGMP